MTNFSIAQTAALDPVMEFFVFDLPSVIRGAAAAGHLKSHGQPDKRQHHHSPMPSFLCRQV